MAGGLARILLAHHERAPVKCRLGFTTYQRAYIVDVKFALGNKNNRETDTGKDIRQRGRNRYRETVRKQKQTESKNYRQRINNKDRSMEKGQLEAIRSFKKV